MIGFRDFQQFDRILFTHISVRAGYLRRKYLRGLNLNGLIVAGNHRKSVVGEDKLGGTNFVTLRCHNNVSSVKVSVVLIL